MLLFCAVLGAGIPIGLAKFGLIPQKTVEVTRMLPPEPANEKKDTANHPSERKEGAAPLPTYAVALQNKPVDLSPEKPLSVRGYIWRGQDLRVLLSDGRTLSQRDKIIKSVDSTGVVLTDGTKIWLEQIKPQQQDTFAKAPEPKKEEPPARSAENFGEVTVTESPTPTGTNSLTVPRGETVQLKAGVPRGTSNRSNMHVTLPKKGS